MEAIPFLLANIARHRLIKVLSISSSLCLQSPLVQGFCAASEALIGNETRAWSIMTQRLAKIASYSHHSIVLLDGLCLRPRSAINVSLAAIPVEISCSVQHLFSCPNNWATNWWVEVFRRTDVRGNAPKVISGYLTQLSRKHCATRDIYIGNVLG
jgi:hypothetical protein